MKIKVGDWVVSNKENTKGSPFSYEGVREVIKVDDADGTRMRISGFPYYTKELDWHSTLSYYNKKVTSSKLTKILLDVKTN